MTVQDFAAKGQFNVLAMPEPNREICGAYIGDLLSWVMGKAKADNIWITIMSNVNVIAVASLSDVSCVLLAEGVTFSNDLLNTAKEKGINVLSTSLASYEAAIKVCGMLQ